MKAKRMNNNQPALYEPNCKNTSKGKKAKSKKQKKKYKNQAEKQFAHAMQYSLYIPLGALREHTLVLCSLSRHLSTVHYSPLACDLKLSAARE